MQNRGELVERIVRKSGLSITALANKLDVSRNTLYNKFKERDLSYDFIIRVGNAVHYNFSLDFPEIKIDYQLPEDSRAHLWRLEKRYKHLLEQYNKLLKFLLKKSHDMENHELHKKIKKFIHTSSS